MEQVLADLRSQHQFILQLLGKPDRLSELIHFVEEVHHPLEEEVLFPFLSQAPWLCQGGPRCTFHMGVRLEQDPLARMDRHLKAYEQRSGETAMPPPHSAPAWLTPQSPLSIPMEEHVISHRLAAALKVLLRDHESPLNREFFPVLHEDFCQLLKMHIEKEDHCLFVMCEQNMKRKKI